MTSDTDLSSLLETFLLNEDIPEMDRKRVWEYIEEHGVDETALKMIDEVLAYQEKSAGIRAAYYKKRAEDLKSALEFEHSGHPLAQREQILKKAQDKADELVKKLKDSKEA